MEIGENKCSCVDKEILNRVFDSLGNSLYASVIENIWFSGTIQIARPTRDLLIDLVCRPINESVRMSVTWK